MPNPRHPTPRHEAPPPGALGQPPPRAKPARRSVRCGAVDGPPRPNRPRPQRTGRWPRPSAPMLGGFRKGECPTPDDPQGDTGLPPRAPSCRPHSAQSLLAGPCSVGLVTGPHAGTPRANKTRVTGPGGTPQRRTIGGGRVPDPQQPSRRREAPSHGDLQPPLRRTTPARKKVLCGFGDGSPRPHSPPPRNTGQRTTAACPKDGRSGE